MDVWTRFDGSDGSLPLFAINHESDVPYDSNMI